MLERGARWSSEAALAAALSYARRCGARAEDAEDIAQEALLKLVINGDAVEDPAAWLFVVVQRLNHRRMRRSSRRLPPIVTSFDPWPGVELNIDARRLLDRVSDRSRTSVCLSWAGYSERESAERMGCSIKTTEKTLHRARRQLRRMLGSANRGGAAASGR